MPSDGDWNREELLQARRDGAELVPNSGRGLRKGDARIGKYLIDYKFTDKNSYTINLAQFNKFFLQAYREGFSPVVVSIFRSENGRKLAIVEWDMLKDLIEMEDKYG